MLAVDGKMRVTDMTDTETMFRIIQSVLSRKVEPFKYRFDNLLGLNPEQIDGE